MAPPPLLRAPLLGSAALLRPPILGPALSLRRLWLPVTIRLRVSVLSPAGPGVWDRPVRVRCLLTPRANSEWWVVSREVAYFHSRTSTNLPAIAAAAAM